MDEWGEDSSVQQPPQYQPPSRDGGYNQDSSNSRYNSRSYDNSNRRERGGGGGNRYPDNGDRNNRYQSGQGERNTRYQDQGDRGNRYQGQSDRGNRYQDGERENRNHGGRPYGGHQDRREQSDSYSQNKPSYRNDSYECTESMEVDPNHIKFIIGKGGSKIREIESSCDVKLQVDKNDNNVKISGATIENINKAIDVIKEVTSGGGGGNRPNRNDSYASYECSESMEVDPNHIKFIIGKGGSKIREIEGSCNVKLQIDKYDNNVKISGATMENINKAIDVIKEVTSGGGGGGGNRYSSTYETT